MEQVVTLYILHAVSAWSHRNIHLMLEIYFYLPLLFYLLWKLSS